MARQYYYNHQLHTISIDPLFMGVDREFDEYGVEIVEIPVDDDNNSDLRLEYEMNNRTASIYEALW